MLMEADVRLIGKELIVIRHMLRVSRCGDERCMLPFSRIWEVLMGVKVADDARKDDYLIGLYHSD